MLENSQQDVGFSKIVANAEDWTKRRSSQNPKSPSALFEENRRYGQDEFASARQTGELAFVKKCRELNRMPSRKLVSMLDQKVMNLSRFGFEDPDIVALSEALRVNDTITALELGENRVRQQGCTLLAQALRRNSSVTALNLSGNEIGVGSRTSVSGKALASFEAKGEVSSQYGGVHRVPWYLSYEFLRKELWFADDADEGDAQSNGVKEYKDRIVDVAMWSIGRLLVVNRTITYLNLSGNKIGDLGVKELVRALDDNTTLRTLDLHKNQITARGAEYIADMFGKNDTLVNVNLAWNALKDRGATLLAQAILQNGRVNHLDLAWNAIGSQGGEAWGKMLAEEDDLQVLNLSNNNIASPEAWTALCEGIQANQSLTGLCITENKLFPAAAKKLFDIVKASVFNIQTKAEVTFEQMERLSYYDIRTNHPTIKNFECKGIEWLVRDHVLFAESRAAAAAEDERLAKLRAEAKAKKKGTKKGGKKGKGKKKKKKK